MNLSLDKLIEETACNSRNRKNFVFIYFIQLFTLVGESLVYAMRYESVHTSSGPSCFVVDRTPNIPSLSGSPACSAVTLLIITLYFLIVS